MSSAFSGIRGWLAGAGTGVLAATSVAAQEPAAWRGEELVFHTFSIVAVDPRTGEAGVAVTTRNPCVGNAVPWVRAGVGAVATQASARMEYGPELLDLMEQGVSPQEALALRLAEDRDRESRQIGVIAVDGRSAQHTGARNGEYAGMRAGPNFVAQGNILIGPDVLDAVARSFADSEGSFRHLADRLIAALAAGQSAGGDKRHGETQSAAVIVADPRPGVARRPDGVAVHINVCEHPDPTGELRRIYDTISETLGFRELSKETGSDVFQLKLMLHALGYFRPDLSELPEDLPDRNLYTDEAVDAVDRFRSDQPGWGTTVPGMVDTATVARLWSSLEDAGKADAVRRRLLDVLRVRR